MSNKLILDLTVRLIQALDKNYDVVDMDTVLAVISALEGATITKEQLETTRLAKHINQLRRRNKSNILAIRAKNLLKKWREMFGITSQAQSEAGGTGTGGTSSATQHATPTQQSVSKQALSSTLQPASPNTNTQLLGENFDNSLSSIGVDFSRTTTTTNTTPASRVGSGSISNTASANFKFNKKSVTGVGAETAAAAIGSRSNGALGKSTNRNITNNSSPATIINANTTANKVKHPTSFKNLITGINVNNVPKQANPSALSPKVLPQIPAASERKIFIIDDDHNQSQPSSSAAGVAKTTAVGVSSPRTHKSMKRKERNSPVAMIFMDHSSSPIAFENLSHDQTTMATVRFSAPHHPSTRNQVITSTIDLHDSNSSSNFAEVTEIVSSTTTTTGTSSKVNGGCNSGTAIGISSNSSSNKRIRKDKKRSNERVEIVTESDHFQPTIDETSRIAFPISGIQEYLSLSNSSMSIFPAGSGGGSGTERFQSAANEDNQPADSSTERDKPDGDLTFAGKFKLNSAGGIDVESSSSYYKGGGTAAATVGVVAARGENKMSVISSGVGGNVVAINNSRDLVSTRGGSTATTGTNFVPFSRDSNESSSISRTSQIDLIDVVNQDSQSMITVDDLRQLHHQKQSSNEKPTPQDIKFPKDVISNASRQQHQYSSKEHNMKPRSLIASTSSSKPSTPNSSVLPIVANANVSSPPVVEQKVPKKRGRKKGSKGVDSVLAQSAGLNTQFLMSPALGSSKKVKTTRELLIDIQSRKIGSSATSSPTLTNWFGTSRPASSCSEPSLHSPRTSDANSTNATMSTAARSTPEKNASNNSIAADELYESDSDTNTSEPSHENVKPPETLTTTAAISSIEEQIKEIMAMLPPVNKQKIDWETCEDIPCTCSLLEIPPEVPLAVDVKTENTLDLLENVDAIKNEEDDEEPVISVSVLPIAPQQLPVQAAPLSSRSPTPNLPHHYSQSAPVSTVTSPVVPPMTKKIGTNHQILPTKSIFDLDFDDDNDPLHIFVEAASKTKNGIISHHQNRQENNSSLKELKRNEDQDEDLENVEKDHQVTTEIKEEHNSQSELKNRLDKITTPHQQQQTVAPPSQQLPEPPDQQMIPLFVNFPTYEVIEDPACEAKQRYEIQTNQITKFHINAFHNCYIPNVNGNWDHSIPANSNIAGDDECLKLENDSLYANVVPKYGCLVKERIPKDLSYIKFTRNFKPNLINKKSDKPPPLPFLGVANIHRRQHFHLHHYHRKLKKKEAAEKEKRSKDNKKSKKKKQQGSNTTIKKEKAKDETEKVEKEIQKNDDVFLEAVKNVKTEVASKKASNVFENISIDTTPPIAMEVDDSSIRIESKIQEPVGASTTSSFIIVSNKSNLLDDDLDQQKHQQQHQCPTINNLTTPSPEKEIFKPEPLPQPEPRLNNDQTQQSSNINDGDEKIKSSPLIVNGNVPHLMNNNSIIKNDDDNDFSCQKKLLNNNHHIEMNDAEGIAASRRSSSCSNSSLKQNQNSINMKLRQHRMEHLQLQERQQKRKRKHIMAPLTTDICEFDADEEANVVGEEQPLPPKVPPLIKRIKLVNGNYAAEPRCAANSITDSSCLDDDNDSDCYHVHSENDIITEEDDDDDDEDFEEIVDDYDEEDGDDDEEEDCGDFHEVVTRDMTSSTTGNNHIVLTIKKTPSKTNSPSSSSMSPAPALIQNVNANAKISPPIVDDVAYLIGEDDDNNDNNSSTKLELKKLLELNSVKAVDLINKTDFFLPETTDVAVYNFQIKKNGDKDHGDEETNENDMPLQIIEDDDENEEEEEESQHEHKELNVAAAGTLVVETNSVQAVSKGEKPENPQDENDNNDDDDDVKSKKPYISVKQEVLTKVELSKSIQLTKKYFRRIELKKRLREGIEQAQKLHRQLFFPYELHTSSGSKILEINSCTSDCTDPSDDETTDSSGSDTEFTTSSSSGNGNLKSRVMRMKRRRRTKLPPGKRRTVAAAGGGNPPSSSSSSSSSSDSSSSASAFTSWTTSDDDDDNAEKKRKQSSKVEVQKEENKVKEQPEPEEDFQQPELPSGNNFLLRSFNHIYVSTEERQRQQQLKQASEYRQHHEVANSGGGGYITLSGDDSKDETVAIMPLQEQHNEGYLKYFDVNSRYNVYGSQSASANIRGVVQSSSRQPPVPSYSPTTTIEDTSVDVETIEQASSEIVVVVEEDDEEVAENKPSTVIMSSVDIDVELIEPQISEATSTTANNRINPDRSVGSINININNIKNDKRSVQMNDKNEQLETTQTEIEPERATVEIGIEGNKTEEDNLVAQEEYRTGIRRVDEDVVDEDGNNCARTQQFKEWHEVLQLRSYNDELLTVLPYVVIE